jgi:hypothetical protein
MVRRALAREGECQLRAFVLSGPQCQGRSHLGIAFARDQCCQYAPAGAPKEIGDHAAQLERGICEELVAPGLALTPCLPQGDPRARHIP